tara:strand:- start:3357 stop:3794 length:438 start_codon:yes stop_codon:yes gene_type:complete
MNDLDTFKGKRCFIIWGLKKELGYTEKLTEGVFKDFIDHGSDVTIVLYTGSEVKIKPYCVQHLYHLEHPLYGRRTTQHETAFGLNKIINKVSLYVDNWPVYKDILLVLYNREWRKKGLIDDVMYHISSFLRGSGPEHSELIYSIV